MSTMSADSALAVSRRAVPTTSILSRDYLTMQPLIAWLRDVAAPASSGILLDWGCGNKPYASVFAPFVQQHLGADIMQNSAGTVDFIVAPGQRLPLESGSIDTVLSTQVLEHVAEPDAYLAEAARVLRHGGLLILTCPGSWMLHEEPNDFARYTSYGLQHLMSINGFTIERLDPCGGAWRLLGQIFLNHTAFGRRFTIPLLSSITYYVAVLSANIVCALLDRANTNTKDTVNYMLLARRS